MARPADAADKVAEYVLLVWERMVKYPKDFAEGDNKKLYELVGECAEQLLEEGVECTYETGWKDVAVWQKKKFGKAGEAERRIREEVRPRLQEARKLKYTRWSVTQGVDGIVDYVDQWFGGQETEAEKLQRRTGEKKKTEAAGSGDRLRSMLDELRRLVDKYAES